MWTTSGLRSSSFGKIPGMEVGCRVDMGMEQAPGDLTASCLPKITLNLNPQGPGDSASMNVTIKGSAGTARSLLENSAM